MVNASSPVPVTRTVIVHCHIFKNAGSSFDWALKRFFGDAFLDHRDDKAMKEGAAYLGPLLESHPELRAFSSHRVILPLPQVSGTELIPAFFLRHPIERVWSVYQFERMQKSDTPGARMAKELDFREYVAWRLQGSVPGVIRNFQTRYCAGLLGGKKKVLDTGDLESAKATLEATPLVGLVERFDESMVVFEHGLASRFPGLDLSYIRQNARPRSGAHRTGLKGWLKRMLQQPSRHNVNAIAQKVLDKLGKDLANQLNEDNTLDRELYSWAGQLLTHRLAEIRSSHEALKEFRRRCRCLHHISQADKGSHREAVTR